MGEQYIQGSIARNMRTEGWQVFNTTVVSPGGFPDLIAFKAGDTVLVEVKDVTGRLSPIQIEQHNRLMADGITVWTVKSWEEVKCLLKERKMKSGDSTKRTTTQAS